MCFPRLKQSFCCCSLRTGMLFIVWISLLWNLYYLSYLNKYDPPEILSFLDHTSLPKLMDGYRYVEFRQLYYVMQVTVMMFALIGIYSTSSCCLTLLVANEFIILVMFVIMTVFQINVGLSHPENSLVGFYLVITAFQYYLYLIILSFYHEVSEGRDGRGQGGIIITSGIASDFSAPPPAPSNPHNIVPSAPYVDSPYAVQPPHNPIINQHCNNSIYPPNEFPHVIIQTEVSPCAPPPYPVPQPVQATHEKPPPYAP